MRPGEPEKKAQLEAFENGIIQMQIQMESSFTRIAASTGKRSVVSRHLNTDFIILSTHFIVFDFKKSR